MKYFQKKTTVEKMFQSMSTLIEAPQHRHGGGPQNRGVDRSVEKSNRGMVEKQERNVEFMAF